MVPVAVSRFKAEDTQPCIPPFIASWITPVKDGAIRHPETLKRKSATSTAYSNIDRMKMQQKDLPEK